MSPSLSIASWSDLDAVYQANTAAALKVVNAALQSPCNTWNYPSPGSPQLQYPCRTLSPIFPLVTAQSFAPMFVVEDNNVEDPQSPVIPWSPTVASSPEFTHSDYPFLAPTSSPVYTSSFADSGITLVDPDTLEPTPVDPNPYVVRSPSPPTPAPTLKALHATAKFDLKQLRATTAAAVVRLAQQELDTLLPPLNQDNWAQLQLTGNITDHTSLEDIPVENIPLPIATAPVATIASPAPPSPGGFFHPALFDLTINSFLFAAPPCLTANDYHPHQYVVIYKQGRHIWYSQEEFINTNFLDTILRIAELRDTQAPFFVTPFHADTLHSIQVHSDSNLPPIHICAKVGKHPWSPNFPFGYIEASFLDLIKFVFSCFPPNWLTHFEGALVPLVTYNFLDGCTAILCGHLHFTEDGITFINCSTCIEDLLHTETFFACFTPLSCVPTRPFDFIAPPSDTPL